MLFQLPQKYGSTATVNYHPETKLPHTILILGGIFPTTVKIRAPAIPSYHTLQYDVECIAVVDRRPRH